MKLSKMLALILGTPGIRGVEICAPDSVELCEYDALIHMADSSAHIAFGSRTPKLALQRAVRQLLTHEDYGGTGPYSSLAACLEDT